MNFNAVRAMLKPMSDEKFEASLRRQLGKRVEDSVTLEEVGLGALARAVVEERESRRQDIQTS